MRDLRLVLPAVCGWLTCAVVIGMPDIAIPLGVTAASVTVVALAAALWWRARSTQLPLFVCLSSAVCALLCVSIAAAHPHRAPAAVDDAARAGKQVTMVVETTQDVTANSPRFRATATQVTISGRQVAARAPLLVFGGAGTFGVGTLLEVRGTLKATTPGDSTTYLLFPRGEVKHLADPPAALHWANGLRSTFRAHAATLPGAGGTLLPGLAIGDTSAVSDTVDAAMKRTSLSHLTAVSGANCAVIVALIMLVGGTLGLGRVGRILWSLTVLAAFVVLVTPEPSVLRAAVMASVALGAMLIGRRPRGLPVVALAVILLLVIDPWLARSYAFILSVFATTALLLGAKPLTHYLHRWVPLPLAATIAVPAVAQAACQPVLILLEPEIPLYGVLANILAAPAAPIATVLGLLSCVLLPLVPPWGHAVASLAWMPSAWIVSVATFFSDAPFAALPWVDGVPGVLLLSAVTALAVLAAAMPNRLWAHRVRGPARVLVALAVACYGGILVGEAVRRHTLVPDGWQIAACDVGQGDAVFVRRAETVALIDTGPDPNALDECMRLLHIDRIHLLVLTHFDLDHVGGTPRVIGQVDTVLVGPSGGVEDDALQTAFRDNGAQVVQATTGMRGTLGDQEWDILWPPKQGSPPPGNDASVVLQLGRTGCATPCLTATFLGDLGEDAQRRLASTARPTPVDVVKVSHHGSRDQYPALYTELAASVGIIGVGSNTYGHPTEQTLTLLSDNGIASTRSDTDGVVVVGGTPESMWVWKQHTPTDSATGTISGTSERGGE